ncbi:hypothetical protein, partial [Aneurinibacillus migulanus]
VTRITIFAGEDRGVLCWTQGKIREAVPGERSFLLKENISFRRMVLMGGENMRNEIVYTLDINFKEKRKSFEYETMDKAVEAFRVLSEKFAENRVVKNFENYSDDIVQLTIGKLYIGHVPSNAAAAFVPEEWFTNVHEEMLIAAKEYYEGNK